MSFFPTHPHNLEKLPPPHLFNKDFWEELLVARTLMAELKGVTFYIPNPLLLITPMVTRESLASSRIEDIHTTLEGVFQSELFPDRHRKEEDKEILHYRDALLWAFRKKVPVSTRLILGIHERLLISGGGQYRKLQNKIENDTTGEVLYTPPIASQIPELMGNWENYANGKVVELDPLIRCAILHYQFEAIHPFSDGNGRTGRILMVIQLVREKLLVLPILFISGYLDRHRPEYYRLLRKVTTHEDWAPYIRFMLKAFASQAQETKYLLLNIVKLKKEIKRLLKKRLPKIYSVELLDALFSFPVLSPSYLAKLLSIHRTTASKYLSLLNREGVLKSVENGKYHWYIHTRLTNIIKKGGREFS